MIWFAVIVGGGILVGLIYYNKRKESAAVESGSAVNRGHDFFRQIHIFKTKTPHLEEIYQAMDKSSFAERSIRSKIDSHTGNIIFQNQALGGSFIATLKLQGQDSGLYLYMFQFNDWKANHGYPSAKDELSGNIVLTSIEKAIVSLDSDAIITRDFVKSR